MVFNAAVSGAKADLLFYIFAGLLSVKVFDPCFRISIRNISLVVLISLFFAFVVLFYNFRGILDSNSQLLDVLGFLCRKLTDRILSNGDMYYMGLPNDVYEKISAGNVFLVMLAPVLSYSFVSRLAGLDVGQLEIGKQLLLAHYPGNDIAGGPTDHFDFFALHYFGLLGGCFFIVLLAFLFCFIRRSMIYSHGNMMSSALMTVFWMKSLSWLLKPGLFLGTILYFSVFLIIVRGVCYCLLVKKTV
jgi:hypothetical protein